MKMSVFEDRWEMKEPFVTSKESITHIETITVCVSHDGPCGRGEALGVDYLGETVETMQEQLAGVKAEVEAGAGTDEIQQLLPPGGARNALDCALWDLEAKKSGRRIHQVLAVPFNPVMTAYTLSLDTPGRMASEAAAHAQFPLLKLKLNNEHIAERLAAVRSARPDAELIIDANCAWTMDTLDNFASELLIHRVSMVEQPLAVGEDGDLEGYGYPVTLCADESCQSMADIEQAAARYSMINIKLDKCGGLTEALQMVEFCRARKIGLMVGNMLGSSLAMAPAFLVAQYCRYADLDGPLWQTTDRKYPMRYDGALLAPPAAGLWG